MLNSGHTPREDTTHLCIRHKRHAPALRLYDLAYSVVFGLTWRVLRRGFPDPSFASPSSGGSDIGLENAVRGLEGSLTSAGLDAETLSRPSLLGVPVLAFFDVGARGGVLGRFLPRSQKSS